MYRKLRLLLKNLLVALGYGSFLIEFCDDCGRRQPLVWWCEDSELWHDATGGHGSHCPECFDKRASNLGIILRWYPRPQHYRLIATKRYNESHD